MALEAPVGIRSIQVNRGDVAQWWKGNKRVTDDEFSWADPQLKERLQRDPAGVLKERGTNVPAGLPVSIVHEVIRIVSLLWVDGRVIPLERFYIDPCDEGLLFGRGVWESTRTIGGVPWLWPLHIERLRRTAALLNIDLAPERLPDSNQVSDYVRSLSSHDVVVRLNATAGRPGKTGIVWMSAALRPQPMASIRLRSRSLPVEKGQPYLTWKTFQYATRLRIGQEAGQAGFDTALLLDTSGNLLEAAHANIFVRLPDGWATPTADGGLLPGTVRRHLLEHAPLPMREQTIPYARLAEVREAFLTNSNVGLVPVAQIDNHHFQTGSETLTLMRWLESEPVTGPSVRVVQPGG
jgi:branched-subunit amino acid aminotransferase/4-amino-4-deoxychorismate lyase